MKCYANKHVINLQMLWMETVLKYYSEKSAKGTDDALCYVHSFVHGKFT